MHADATPASADQSRCVLDRITHSIIGAAQRVSGQLGDGFVEKVYENALAIELRKRGHAVDQQRPIHVFYGDDPVGTYVTDIVVDDAVLVEVKAVSALCGEHHAQCINYLKATGYRVCLLMNFGNAHMRFRRIVWKF